MLCHVWTFEIFFHAKYRQLDDGLDPVASSIVKKLLFGIQNHNSCIAPRALSDVALPQLEVQRVYAVPGHIAVPVSYKQKST